MPTFFRLPSSFEATAAARHSRHAALRSSFLDFLPLPSTAKSSESASSSPRMMSGSPATLTPPRCQLFAFALPILPFHSPFLHFLPLIPSFFQVTPHMSLSQPPSSFFSFSSRSSSPFFTSSRVSYFHYLYIPSILTSSFSTCFDTFFFLFITHTRVHFHYFHVLSSFYVFFSSTLTVLTLHH